MGLRPIGVPLAIVLLVMLPIAVGALARLLQRSPLPRPDPHWPAAWRIVPPRWRGRCAACGDIVAMRSPINRIARLMRQ